MHVQKSQCVCRLLQLRTEMGLDGMQILLEVQKISQEINEEWDRIIGGV